MRSTFTKLFLSFWLIQFLILILTIFIAMREFESQEVVYTSTFGAIYFNGLAAIKAYEGGGCDALNAVKPTFTLGQPDVPSQPAVLFDAVDHPLCQSANPELYSSAARTIFKDGFLGGERHGDTYIVGMQVKDANGRKFAYIVKGTYPRHVYIPYREILPRLGIALIVSVFVTFGTTMAITRPISSLRDAARQLAAGNLRARVKWPKRKAHPKNSDELWGLVHDFNHMADRLESLVDAQMMLMRDVSHELRSPLARLSVALELAREEAQPGMEVQLERIERETGRLNSLIGQLLSLSHLESTKQLPEGQSVSLNEVIQELLPDMEYEAQRRNCQVSFTSESECQVDGSRELLGRAIENVIRNAIAYTSEGSAVEIKLSCEERVASDLAVLQVRDHGPGVPEDGLKSIFRPFFRLDLSRQRSTGGYGVGLAITERAIRLHGGGVWARNAKDGGLIVEMRVPAHARRYISQRSTA
jgi:two-component system, OmpR family, sensor histidine kinase CpxA